MVIPVRNTNYLMKSGPVTCKEIAETTVAHAVLVEVLEYVQHGWLKNVVNTEVKRFWKCQDQLSVQQDCLLYGDRIILEKCLWA